MKHVMACNAKTLLLGSRSSPDEAGFVSTAGNKGSSLSTPGTVRSTPSSEALDVVADLRYEALRFRSLPLHTPQQQAPRTKETNGNLFNEDEHMMKQYQPVVLNGNTNAQNIEDLYAKVCRKSFCSILSRVIHSTGCEKTRGGKL